MIITAALLPIEPLFPKSEEQATRRRSMFHRTMAAVCVAVFGLASTASAQSGPAVYPSQPTETQSGGLNNPHLAFDANNPFSQASGAVSVFCTNRTASPKVLETTWSSVPAGYSPTTLTVKWSGNAAGAIMQGATKVEVELLYSLNGGEPTTPFAASAEYLPGNWSKTNMTYSNCQSGGSNYPCSFSGYSQVSLSPTQDTSLLKVTAKLTATLLSCGNQVDGTNAAGAIAVADIRIDTACTVPIFETTSSAGWNTVCSPDGMRLRTTHNFMGTVIGFGSEDFAGRTVHEVDGGDTEDGCHFPGSSVAKITAVVTGGSWTIGNGNTWGSTPGHWYDTVGWTEVAANYYQDNSLGLPCYASGTQVMHIDCQGTSVPYMQGTLAEGVSTATVSAARQGNVQEREWYQVPLCQ